MNYREAARKLEKLGCVEKARRGRGSHRKWSNPATGGVAALQDQGRRELKTGTVRAVVRQLDIGWTDFLKA